MGQISEYEGERFLYVMEEALEPTNAIANNAQWDGLKARITAVLSERGVEPLAWKFRKSHYRHGGKVHLILKYTLQEHQGTPVQEP
jgi:hypothetical protein